MEDYEIESDLSCPDCGHSPLHSRDCTNWCEDGWIDESEDDTTAANLTYKRLQ